MQLSEKHIKERMYETVVKIRAFEDHILDMFGNNLLSGTTHTYIGQEATAAAIMQYIKDKDTVFSNHRCHGHFLAYGGPEEALLAELMSKEAGVCQGRGGSQHLHYKNFYSNGIQGGIVPNALGVAFADKLDKNGAKTVVFLGDGTLGQGVVYESWNLAAILAVPVVFVIEDNQYAMTTRRKDAVYGDIQSRIQGFGIRAFDIESTDTDELYDFFGEVFRYTDSKKKPSAAVVHNYRLGAHSKGDDTRDPEEIGRYQKNDPYLIVQRKIGERAEILYKTYRQRLQETVDRLSKERILTIQKPGADWKEETTENSAGGLDQSLGEKRKKSAGKIADGRLGTCLYHGKERCVERIRDAFAKNLERDRNILLYGEDIRDPYGGAFKATRGLSEEFDGNILNMPISEACMVGMGVGLALNGKIPVIEMMFGDFVTLGFDQILNHAVKYSWVYGQDVAVPMVLRLPMGAKRGYGPTHSQSLEKFLIGVPGLDVIALSPFHDPKVVYDRLFLHLLRPTAVIENKKMYAERVKAVEGCHYGDYTVMEYSSSLYSTLHISLDADEAPDIYILTYGGMVDDCMDASMELMLTDEIQADVIVISALSPLPVKDLKEIIRRHTPVMIVEEGTKTAGIGAELAAQCMENGIADQISRVAAYDMPIPNGIQLERQVIPNKEWVVSEGRRICG